jgi:hypothetical protein
MYVGVPDVEGLYEDQRTSELWWCQIARQFGHVQVVFEPAFVRRAPRAMSGDVVVEWKETIESQLYRAWSNRQSTAWWKTGGLSLEKLKAGDDTEFQRFKAAAAMRQQKPTTREPGWVDRHLLPNWIGDPKEDGSLFQSRTGQGWPLSALRHELIWESTKSGELHGGWKTPDWFHIPGRILAYRVIPLGFAINSILYAAILWLLLGGPFALRRVARVRHGLCPNCAYPMGGSPTCTECGRPLPQRAVV